MVSATSIGLLVAGPMAILEIHSAGAEQCLCGTICRADSARIASAPAWAASIFKVAAPATQPVCRSSGRDQFLLRNLPHNYMVQSFASGHGGKGAREANTRFLGCGVELCDLGGGFGRSSQGDTKVKMAKQSNEAFFWILFSAGGVIAAILIPVHLLLFGLAFPLGWLPVPAYENLIALAKLPAVRIYLFLLCSLSLFHWAHRFRYTLYDGLQVKHLNEVIFTLCYGGAIAGTVFAGYLLWNIP